MVLLQRPHPPALRAPGNAGELDAVVNRIAGAAGRKDEDESDLQVSSSSVSGEFRLCCPCLWLTGSGWVGQGVSHFL